MRMQGSNGFGARRRYLAEQEVFMAELFGKAEGFTTPITKPVASFKAPAGAGAPAKPKVAALKPTGNTLPSPTQRLASLKENMQAKIGQTPASTGAPAAVGTTGVGKSDRLRRKGKFQPTRSSKIVKADFKTSISEDDARKLVDRHGLKGPLPKTLNREQKMAAYEARYVSAGGKKAEKWNHRAQLGDRVKNGGLAVATTGGAAWLATRGKLKGKALSPKVRHHAETVAGAGATAGGAGELYAAHARHKRSSYASAPAGVARGALTRMRSYTP